MSINNNVWQHSGVAACISVIFSLVAYLLGFEALVSPAFWGANFLLIVLSMILISRTIRENEGGHILFFRLFLHLSIGVLCILLARQAFNYILFNFINPDLIDYMIEFNNEKTAEMLEMFNASQQVEMETVLADSENSTRFGYSLVGTLIGIVGLYVTWIVPALIISAIYQRKSPDAIV